MNLEFCRHFFEKEAQISSFINIRLVGAELSHADGRTDRRTNGHEEANDRFSQFCESAKQEEPTLLKWGLKYDLYHEPKLVSEICF